MTLMQKLSFVRVSLLSSTKHTGAKQEHNTAATSTSASSPSSFQQLALSIPEIVKHILSFLTLQDRQRAARLVCKEWSAICRELIPVRYTWTLPLASNDDDYERQASKVSRADTLTIRVDDMTQSVTTSSPRRLAAWTKMMGILSDLMYECHQRHKYPHLRSLRLEMGVLESLDVQLPQLPRLLCLTTLRIDMVDKWDIIYLFTIFKACPNLEELIFRPTLAAEEIFQRAFTLRYLPSLTQGQELAIINESHILPTLLRLRTCILHHVMVTQPALEAFLQASPHLTKLVLAQCTEYANRPPSRGRREQIAGIAEAVSKHCPDIKSFHICVNPVNFSGLYHNEVASIIEKLPNLDEYNFMNMDLLNRSLVKGLRMVCNRVTTLNIFPYETSISLYHIPIREVLCTFEHLVHLRAPHAIYNAEDMDLNYMVGQFRDGWNDSKACHTLRLEGNVGRYIWACRGLRTLHLLIPSLSRYQRSPDSSYIIFGFLSRMCPHLQELYLTGTSLDLSFQGGLCLLTRLEELERLRIETSPYHQLNDGALFWIRQTPTLSAWDLHFTYRLQRRQTLERCADYIGVAPPKVAAARSDVLERGQEMGMDLSKIGHPNDLLEWMDARYGSSASGAEGGREKEQMMLSPAWPKLESFWVESWRTPRSFKRTEKYMAKVRPNVEFGLQRRPQSPYHLTTLRYL
ncbi:hypothetical protein BGW39_010841 [Mortierella sp. 14UC]|nr:hypothetical protein BGW39_010841 [Mortierella sp. 14UC]